MAEPGWSRPKPRPWCCPEHSCDPVWQVTDAGDITDGAAGVSFSCFGMMARPVEFVYDGEQHKNDLNSCHYTPLKGVIRWQETTDDWRLLANAYAGALDVVELRRESLDLGDE